MDLGEYGTAENLLNQASDTYSSLQDERGAAWVLEVQNRLAEKKLHQAGETDGEPAEASASSGSP